MTLQNFSKYLIFLLFLILLFLNLIRISPQHFTQLAKSFLEGNLAFTQQFVNISDLVFYQDKYYLPLGPFPAVLLMPFVYLHNTFAQGYLAFLMTVINFYLLYKIARILKLTSQKALLITVFFVFGSIYTPLAALPGSWYFAQIVACTLLIIAIFEFLTKKRYLLIGITLALAAATRLNLIFASVFFLIDILKSQNKPANFLKFSIPLIAILIILAQYNYLRFGNYFELGYNMQIVPSQTASRRSEGLFSAKHIPANLFYMFFKGPEPVLRDNSHILKPPFITFDSYGLSLFFLSPILLLLYKANLKSEIVKRSAVTSFIMILPIITYYGIGHRQVGFRYALDFFPFVFLILSTAIEKVNVTIIYPLVLFGVFFAFYFSFLYLFGMQVN